MHSLPLLFEDPTHNHPKRSHKWLRNSFFRNYPANYSLLVPPGANITLSTNLRIDTICVCVPKVCNVKRRDETYHDMQGLLLKPASVTKDRSQGPKKCPKFQEDQLEKWGDWIGMQTKTLHFSKDTSCFGLTTNIDIYIDVYTWHGSEDVFWLTAFGSYADHHIMVCRGACERQKVPLYIYTDPKNKGFTAILVKEVGDQWPLVKPLLSVFLSIPASRSLDKKNVLLSRITKWSTKVYFIFLSSTTQPTNPAPPFCRAVGHQSLNHPPLCQKLLPHLGRDRGFSGETWKTRTGRNDVKKRCFNERLFYCKIGRKTSDS